MADRWLKDSSEAPPNRRPDKPFQSAVLFSGTNRLACTGNYSPITYQALLTDPAIAGRKMCFDASFYVLRDIVGGAIPARNYAGLTDPQVQSGAAVLWARPKQNGFYQALAEGSDISLVHFESRNMNTVYVDAKMQVAGPFAKRTLAPVRRMVGFDMAEIERRFPDFYPVLNRHCSMQATNLVVTFHDLQEVERLRVGQAGKLFVHKIYAEAIEETSAMRHEVFKAVVTTLSQGTSPAEKADARATLLALAATLNQQAQNEDYPRTLATQKKQSRAESMVGEFDKLIAALPSAVPLRAPRTEKASVGRQYAPA